MARLKDRYEKEIVPAMMREYGYKNIMEVPRLEKIVVNMGLGEAITNIKIIDSAADEIRQITGQQPVVTRAKRSVANFKVREGMPIGCMVTLRRERMYEFLDRLVNVTLPRVRDFKGLSPKAFDGRGNYTLGIREQSIFAEIDPNDVTATQGMDVTIVTTARHDEEARQMLELMGMPFAKK